MNDTRKAGETPGLFVELMSLLEKCEPAFGQKRVFNRVLALVMAEIFTVKRLQKFFLFHPMMSQMKFAQKPKPLISASSMAWGHSDWPKKPTSA